MSNRIVPKAGLVSTLLGGSLFSICAVLPMVMLPIERRRLTKAQPPAPLPLNPSVDVIVPAYLEAGVIGTKIEDLRVALSQHSGRTRVIVVASDMETAAASAAADLVITTGRNGKAAACNAGVAESDADIIVFTDANCRIQPLMTWVDLMLEDLGCWHLVSASKGETGGMDGAFWALEKRIKSASQETMGTLAVAGEFLATRRGDLRPLKPGVILDDLDIAFSYAFRDLTVTVSSRVTTLEPAAPPDEQWERRVRMASGLFGEALPQTSKLITRPVGRLFLAHKMARTTVGCTGFWLAVAGLSSLCLPVSLIAFGIAIYGAAAYAGKVSVPKTKALRPVVSIAGLQAIPVMGALRALRYRRSRRVSGSGGLWRKVAR